MGAVLGLAFSIAVILSTIGLMDGFVYGLKSSLRSSHGDIQITGRNGFFDPQERLAEQLSILGLSDESWSSIIQSEGFLLFQSQSRGVLMRATDSRFSQVSGLNILPLSSGEVAIGPGLAHDFSIGLGDMIGLTFSQGSRGVRGLPVMRSFKVSQIVEHNLHEQDQRYIYLSLEDMSHALDVGGLINMVAINIFIDNPLLQKDILTSFREVDALYQRLQNRLDWSFSVAPYWKEFSTLIEAVEVEKGMITLILQIIVLISVFNVVALIIYFNERKAREIFLFQALGMGQKKLKKTWLLFSIVVWLSASFLSLFFVAFFNFALVNLTFLHLPSDVYHLQSFSLKISWENYLFVFMLAFIWIFIVSWISFFRIRNKSLLSGLRQEFS